MNSIIRRTLATRTTHRLHNTATPTILSTHTTSGVQLRTAYGDKIIDHYSNPRNVGSLDRTSEDVGTGLVGAPACGDVMKFQIQVKDGVIVDAKFKVCHHQHTIHLLYIYVCFSFYFVYTNIYIFFITIF